MYTAQQISESIASNGSLPAGNPAGPDSGAQAGMYPYPLIDAAAIQQFPNGTESAWSNTWNTPSRVHGAMTEQWHQWNSSFPGNATEGPYWNDPWWGAAGDAAAPAPAMPGAGGSGEQRYAPPSWVGPRANAAKAFDLTNNGGGCGMTADSYNDEKQSLYSAHRLFGNIRLAQGKSEVGEVLLNGKATIVNPALLKGSVEGRDQSYASADAYRDDPSALRPFALEGGSVGGIRPELYVGTVSEGLSAPPKSEALSQRAFLPTDMPSTFNIYPESEAAAARKENTCRLNRIQANYIKSRLAAASTMQW